MDFEVTPNPWCLYVCSSDYASRGYEGSGGWNIPQERYIFAFVFEYAVTLGLVDMAFVAPEDSLWLSQILRVLRIIVTSR